MICAADGVLLHEASVLRETHFYPFAIFYSAMVPSLHDCHLEYPQLATGEDSSQHPRELALACTMQRAECRSMTQEVCVFGLFCR